MALAKEIGLDPNETANMLAGEEYAEEVRKDEQEARTIGVQGVPFFVINRKIRNFRRAAKRGVLISIRKKAWNEEQPLTILHDSAGDGCTDIACAPNSEKRSKNKKITKKAPLSNTAEVFFCLHFKYKFIAGSPFDVARNFRNKKSIRATMSLSSQGGRARQSASFLQGMLCSFFTQASFFYGIIRNKHRTKTRGADDDSSIFLRNY
ncbi:hypothetical protein GCM10020331_060680 [Ectobacillus funiculus]